MKSEAVSALPKLRRGLGGADFEDGFLKDAGHDRVYCFRLAPKVRLPSDSENDRQSLVHHILLWDFFPDFRESNVIFCHFLAFSY